MVGSFWGESRLVSTAWPQDSMTPGFMKLVISSGMIVISFGSVV